jgi:hypothetical protein
MAWYDGATSLLFGQSLNSDRSKLDDRKYLVDQFKQGITNAQQRQAPQAAGASVGPAAAIDTSRGDQFRSQEMALAGQLSGVASGQQRGAGELAARRAGRDALGNVLGTATMARGANAAGAGRAAARGAAQVGLNTAGAAAQAAAGDQAQARGQLAGVLSQGRTQDLATAGQNAAAQNQAQLTQAQLTQQTQLENMRARLQSMGMSDEVIGRYLAGLTGINTAEAQMRTGDNGLLPGLLQSGGQILGASQAAATGGAA